MKTAIKRSALVALVSIAGINVCLAANSAEPVRFYGLCDGSAAVSLSNNTLLVASDERNSLYTYNVEGGQILAEANLNERLTLPDNKADKKTGMLAEIDLEAVTTEGDKLWWIGSHGHSQSREVSPNRRSLFASNIPSSDLADLIVVSDRINLIDVLLKDRQLLALLPADVRDRAPADGGLNIEGLSTLDRKQYGKSALLLGFRSPPVALSNGKPGTLLVAIEADKTNYRVRQFWLLDMNGRGIRDLLKTDAGYVLLAGPEMDNDNGSFALFQWNTRSLRPTWITDVAGLRAEAIVDRGDSWLLLSDDDNEERAPEDEKKMAGKDCKKLLKKFGTDAAAAPYIYFRGVTIAKP